MDSLLTRPPATTVREAEIDGAISIFDRRTRRVIVLNHTASDIWRLADGRHSVTDIVRLLAAAYSVGAEAIRGDVERTVGELRAAGLLSG